MSLNTHTSLSRSIALTLTSVLFWGAVLSSAAQAQAQVQSVVVDPRAGSNTTVGAAGNGVPMVNINTPKSEGDQRYPIIHPDRNPVLQITAHAVLGGTAAALGGKDFASGALGGLVEGVLDNVVTGSNGNDKWSREYN